ncbi:MAG TPA: DUF72 domain-containing protein [Candidatus Binatia bacterium]|nr:DUF72 domain-containing protein [Candidatus Binatia bacterium]
MAARGAMRLGTSAFTAAGWEGVFYPEEMKPADYLTFYAQHFDTVEIDSTYYRTPLAATVRGWEAKTPPGFLFSAKVPQTVTHEKVLVDCDAEFQEFVERMQLLGEKLGVLLLQFPYFNKMAFASVDGFLDRLRPFLKRLPRGVRFALEVRNKGWLGVKLYDLLRSHQVALALIDHPWMPRPSQLFRETDPVTADFAYIRWLGDRKGIEERTKSWEKTIVDRRSELTEWANVCWKISGRGVLIFAYANNHYAGHAPATVRLFQEIWGKQCGVSQKGAASSAPTRSRGAACGAQRAG